MCGRSNHEEELRIRRSSRINRRTKTRWNSAGRGRNRRRRPLRGEAARQRSVCALEELHGQLAPSSAAGVGPRPDGTPAPTKAASSVPEAVAAGRGQTGGRVRGRIAVEQQQRLRRRGGRRPGGRSYCACPAGRKRRRADSAGSAWRRHRSNGGSGPRLGVGLPGVFADWSGSFGRALRPNIRGFNSPDRASMASRIASPSSRRRRMCQSRWLSRIDRRRRWRMRRPCGRCGNPDDTRPTVTISRCMCLRLQPFSTNSTASQSSNSGCVGRLAHDAEIAGRGDDADAEMVLPETIDDDAGRQRVVLPRQPSASAERRPVVFRSAGGVGVGAAQEKRESRLETSSRLAPVAALQAITSAALSGPRR